MQTTSFRFAKTYAPLLLAGLGAAVLSGCHEDGVYTPGNCVQAVAPVGLYSVTGDGQVAVYWIPVEPENVSQFVVYRSTSSDGGFHEIGHTNRDYFVDNTVANGVTYYYAVTAQWPNSFTASFPSPIRISDRCAVVAHAGGDTAWVTITGYVV